MSSPPDKPRDRLGAAVFSVIAIVGGLLLLLKGIRGLDEGATVVTAETMHSGPFSPVQAIISGVAMFVIGFFTARLALKKKEADPRSLENARDAT